MYLQFESFGDSWCLTVWTYRWFLVSHHLNHRWFLASHHLNLLVIPGVSPLNLINQASIAVGLHEQSLVGADAPSKSQQVCVCRDFEIYCNYLIGFLVLAVFDFILQMVYSPWPRQFGKCCQFPSSSWVIHQLYMSDSEIGILGHIGLLHIMYIYIYIYISIYIININKWIYNICQQTKNMYIYIKRLLKIN